MRRIVLFAFVAAAFVVSCRWELAVAASGAEPNLLAHWKFDEGGGTDANDSASTNDGILNGDPTWVPGKLGPYALDFDGSGDYVEVPDDDSINPRDELTIACWIFNRGGQSAGIYKYASCPGEPASPGNSRAYFLQILETTGMLRFWAASSAVTGDYLESASTVSLNEWHHIAATFNRGSVVIYIDGEPDNSGTISVTGIMNDAQPLTIGGFWSYCGVDYWVDRINGMIDDVRIYNRALSEQEIVEIYYEESTGPVIKISPTALDFGANEGGSNPEDQVFSIWNCWTGTLNWTITQDCGWLDAEPNMGSSTGEANEVTLSVDISGLAGGIYECDLTVSDPCALNSPQTVAVTLDVTGPVFEVSATDFEFDANEDWTNPADQMFTIRNIGGGTLNWDVAYDCDWLEVEPNSGSSTGETNDVTLSVDINGLDWGLYDCNLTIFDANAENSPITVSVSLEITEVWRNQIVFPDDPFNSEVIFESDPRWVKFHIKLDDPCTVYYQNCKLYTFHYHFATEWLEPFIGMSVPEYFDVTLYEPNQLAVLGAVLIPPMEGNPPVPTFEEYAMQFIGYDPYTKEQIRDMFNVVKASVVADPCVQALYFPTYEQLQVAEDNRAWFESEGIVIDSLARWIEGNIGYSEGWAIGELKYFPAGEIQVAYLNGQFIILPKNWAHN